MENQTDDWSFACRDWWSKLKAGKTPIPDLPLDTEAAEKAVSIYNNLRLPDVIGQPTFGKAGEHWSRDFLGAAFGSIDKITGRRRVGEIFNLVPKKNSKTANAASLGLTFMLQNERPNADGMIVGPAREVADTQAAST